MSVHRAGENFDRYHLEKKLGQGAFSQVFLATDKIRDIQVALKILSPISTDNDRALFQREVRTLMLLSNHEHIVTILDFGTEDATGDPFIATEYAPKGSLKEMLSGQAPLNQVVQYVKQIANALRYAHDYRVIHRDVKPGNIFIGANEGLLLGDFGLSVQYSSGLVQSEGSQGSGTPLYMAPEQIRGNAQYNSDQYALAVVTYEWLCGSPPFTGMQLEAWSQHLFSLPQPLRERNSMIPMAVESVVMKGLQKKAEDRYSDVLVYADALEAASKASTTEIPRPYTNRPPSPTAAYPSRIIHSVNTTASTGVVVAESGGDYRSINAAIRSVSDNTRILLKPGIYEGPIFLTKPVEIVGDGPREDVIIQSSGGSCVVMSTSLATVRNLTLQCLAGQKHKKFSAVEIPRGLLKLEDCDITSDSLSCIIIRSAEALPHIQNCWIHGSNENGILIYDNAQGLIEHCHIFGNRLSGVEIKEEGRPTLYECDIYQGKQDGLFIHDHGKGRIEKCRIYENNLSGIEIKDDSHPVLIGCHIHSNVSDGILIWRGSGGTIEGCFIYENAVSGVVIKGSHPTLLGCTIRDGKQVGIFAQEAGQGNIQDCHIFRHAFSGVEIKGEHSDLTLNQCTIYDCRGSGVLIQDSGTGTIRDCTIFTNSWAGIEIREKGRADIFKCKIRQNKRVGIHAHDQAAGKVEKSDLTDNVRGPLDIDGSSSIQQYGNHV